MAWQLHDNHGKLISRYNFIIKPEGFNIPFKAQQVHGISTERAPAEGHDLLKVLELFRQDTNRARLLVGHNIEFDVNIIGAEFIRKGLNPEPLLSRSKLDTGVVSTEFCQLSGV